jgi:hypothetical protein
VHANSGLPLVRKLEQIPSGLLLDRDPVRRQLARKRELSGNTPRMWERFQRIGGRAYVTEKSVPGVSENLVLHNFRQVGTGT